MSADAATSTATRGPSVWVRIGSTIGYTLGFPAFLVGVWIVSSAIDAKAFFPAPSKIWDAFVETWVGPAFIEDVVPSLARLALGLALSIILGIAAGTLIGLVRWLRELAEPMLEFFRAIPPPAMIPVIALFLGITDTMKVVVIVLGTVWPILLNTIEGVRSTDSVMKDTAKSFQLTGWQRLWFLVLPAANPRIMTGVRQAISIALILMVISEMNYASSGLGSQIVYFQRNYLIPEMWSGIVLLGLVGVFMATVFGFVERRVLRWYHGLKEVEHG